MSFKQRILIYKLTESIKQKRRIKHKALAKMAAAKLLPTEC